MFVELLGGISNDTTPCRSYGGHFRRCRVAAQRWFAWGMVGLDIGSVLELDMSWDGEETGLGDGVDGVDAGVEAKYIRVRSCLWMQ